jgi:hypothetical protein
MDFYVIFSSNAQNPNSNTFTKGDEFIKATCKDIRRHGFSASCIVPRLTKIPQFFKSQNHICHMYIIETIDNN